MHRPIAKGAEPLISFLRESLTACTTKTNRKVNTASTRNPCPAVTFGAKFVSPSLPSNSVGVTI